jgi:hypothetical protein
MRENKVKILIVAALMGSLCLSAHAKFTETALPSLNLDMRILTGGATYDPLIPSTQTFNGVPFTVTEDAQGNTAWSKAGAASATLDIPVNVFGVTKAYTIANTLFGASGATVGAVTFVGSGGNRFSVSLVEGTNIRDHFDGQFVNVIDGVTAMPAFNVGPGRARLDMQVFTLPAAFADETLTDILFTSAGGDLEGIPFLVAATVETPNVPVVPVPGAMLLGAVGAAVVGVLRRRSML